MFTLGPNNTAQQYDLGSPPTLVANVQHPANLLPPSPPVSIEEMKKQDASMNARKELSAVPVNVDMSSSEDDRMSPLARIAREMDQVEQNRQTLDRVDNSSPVSSRSRSSASASSRSSADSQKHAHGSKHSNRASRAATAVSDVTSMSFGSSIHTQQSSNISSRESFSISSTSSMSREPRRHRTGSRLRHEVHPSPSDTKVVDLFKFTRARLSDIPYRHPQVLDNSHLTNHDLRRQMLSTIFGWDGEADSLVHDEISRHPTGSPSKVLLAKWVGEVDTDIMASSAESMTSSDWMLLALSGIGGTASQAKVARAYVQRLLEKEDVHTAATIMIGMGDQNDAIEIYVSHKRWMEALILTCLVFPGDWQRQSELIRKWGEWAVQHGQQQLAIRCFSCTGSESSEPWSSPGAQQATFTTRLQNQSIPEVLSPPLSPPSSKGPQRSIAKTSALKLITSFNDKGAGNSKFFGLNPEDERTPINGAGGVTPIAESALSPTPGETSHTAFLRPSNRSVYNTPASARTATPGGFTRQRLPSIGEMPSDVIPRMRLEVLKPFSPVDSTERLKNNRSQPDTLTNVAYTPVRERATSNEPVTQRRRSKGPALPNPTPETFDSVKQDARTRNGSRDRKPDGLHIQWPPMESVITGEYMTSPEGTSSSRHTDVSTASSRRAGTRSVVSLATTSGMSSTRSPTTSDRSGHSRGTLSPVVTGRSLDQYISSLESAQHVAHRSRHASRDKKDRGGRTRSSSRKTAKADDASEGRGRTSIRHTMKTGKRSPTSPIPMSPEDLKNLGAVGYDSDHRSDVRSTTSTRTNREGSRVRSGKATSKARRSPESIPQSATKSKPSSRIPSREHSRRPASPDSRALAVSSRGRSQARSAGSTVRSPSSPLPMSLSPQAKHYTDQNDYPDLKNPQDDLARIRSKQRNDSRMRDRGSSAIRDVSLDRARRARSTSRQSSERARSKSTTRQDAALDPRSAAHTRSYSDQRFGNVQEIKDARALKREQAARELEERRKSLAARPSAPPIPHPAEISLSPLSYRPSPVNFPERPKSQTTIARPIQPRVQTAGPSFPEQTPASTTRTLPFSPTSSQIGLPATPRAMRHPKFDPEGNKIPDVPQIPERFDSAPPSAVGSLSRNSLRSGTSPATEVSYNATFENLTLPKTVYQAAPRRLLPRSASAPIPDDLMLPKGLPTHPAFQAGLFPGGKRGSDDNPRASPSNSGNVAVMRNIDEAMEGSSQHHNPDNDNLTPPPPPPPPIIPELQHLARPHPPPPPPLYRPSIHETNTNTHSIVSGVSSGSGVIEIVMDDDTTNPTTSPATSNSKPPSLPPKINTSLPPNPGSPPLRSSTRSLHSRNTSETDTSITGRISRAADRLRSASRGRNSKDNASAKSPPHSDKDRGSPYESIGGPQGWARTPGYGLGTSPLGGEGAGQPGQGGQGGAQMQQQPQPQGLAKETGLERHPREVRASALKAMEMEGNMI